MATKSRKPSVARFEYMAWAVVMPLDSSPAREFMADANGARLFDHKAVARTYANVARGEFVRVRVTVEEVKP